MFRVIILLGVCLLTSPAWATPPNILLIMADDLGKESLSVYGNPTHKTPHIDRLAKHGVIFDRFFASQGCSSARVALLTGQMPQTTGWLFNIKQHEPAQRCLDPGWNTLPRSLQQLGYTTAAFGKWHIGKQLRCKNHPTQLGFDTYALSLAPRYWGPAIWEDGQRNDDMTHARDVFSEDLFVEKIRAFIHATPTPWFLQYWSNLPHKPFVPTPKAPKAKSPEMLHYPDMVHYLDVQVGKVLQTLQEAGIEDETVVVFLADNESSQQVGGRKGSLNGMNVPLIVRYPDVVPPGRETRLASIIDLFPTLVSLAGGNQPNVDGVPLLPLLFGTKGTPRTTIYWQKQKNPTAKRRWIVRTTTHSLRQDGALYTLQTDPHAAMPRYPADDTPRLRRIRRELSAIAR